MIVLGNKQRRCQVHFLLRVAVKGERFISLCLFLLQTWRSRRSHGDPVDQGEDWFLKFFTSPLFTASFRKLFWKLLKKKKKNESHSLMVTYYKVSLVWNAKKKASEACCVWASRQLCLLKSGLRLQAQQTWNKRTDGVVTGRTHQLSS